jgi:hypothetical protein
MNYFVKKILLLIVSFINIFSFAQTTYTWNGSSSSDWNTPTNWAPAGVPTATDNVIIVTGANNCTVSSSVTVNNFTMNNGTFNLGSNTLNINGNATFNLGTINGSGTINCNGTNTIFGTTGSGPTINPSVNVTSLSIRSQRTTYNAPVNFTKTGVPTGIDNWRGGNTFNSTFTLTNNASNTADPNGDIYLGSNNGDPTDVFNGRAIFNLTGTARIRVPQSGSCIFNGVTEFNAMGYGANFDRIQPARTGTATCTFNDSVYFNINSATSDIHVALDPGTSCIFNGPVICNRLSGSNAPQLELGRNGTVTFNHNIILNNNSTGEISITTGTGTSTLASGRTFLVGSDGFNSGSIHIQNFTQLGTTNQTLILPGTASIFIGAASFPCTFNANIVNFEAGRVRIQETTFNGTSQSFTKTGATGDDCGGNIFNGTVNITNTGNSEFRFSSVIAADIFTSTVTITNSGNGVVSLSRSFTTNYPENIIINNPSATVGGGIFFGANGGISNLANGKTISVGSGGYDNGYLYLYRFNQIGTTAQNINLSGPNTLLRMGNPVNLVAGCNFQANFTGSARRIELTGNTFQGTTVFNHTGNSATQSDWGGNLFNGVHTINISGTGSMRCSHLLAAETYNSTVTFNLTNSGNLRLSNNFDTNYPENITLTSTSTGSVNFGENGGSSTLANGKTISIGGAGYVGNFLRLYSFNQLGTTAQTLTINGPSSQLELGSPTNIAYGCTFNGNLNFTSVNWVITSSTFNGNCNFLKTGAGTNDDFNGNNTFNGNLSFTNNCSVNNQYIRMSNTFGADTYNGIVTASTSCNGGGFIFARTFDGFFNQNTICNITNNSNILFGAGNALTGIATLASGRTITCGTFDSGILSFRRFNQVSNTAQNLISTGTGHIEFGATIASGVANSFSNWDGDVTVNTGGYTAINNSTFQRNFTSTARNYANFTNSIYNITTGNTSLTRMAGTVDDDRGGNNIIHGNFTFNNNGTNRFRTGVTAHGGDTFNGNVTINNSGTGTISFAYNNGTNSINGNLNLLSFSTGSIIFGEAATANATTLSGVFTAASGNYTNGTINLRYLTQNGGANSITGTSSAVAFTLNNCIIAGNTSINTVGTTTVNASTFNGSVSTVNSGTTTVTASTFNANVTMNNTNTTTLRTSTYNATNNITSTAFILGGTLAQGNTFNGTTTFNKNGTSNDDTNGGNTFNALTTFNTTNASGRWRLGVNAGDNFNANVVFNQNAAGLLSPAYDAISNFGGDITVSSPTGVAITFGAGNGRATLVNGNLQNIYRTSGNNPIFRRLTSNKSANHTILHTPIEISTDLNLTNRNIYSSSTNLLIMLAGSAVGAVSDSSFVHGPVRKVGNSAFTFPIGKEGNYYGMHFYSAYRPIVISAPSTNTHHFTAEYFMEDPHPTYNHGSLGAGIAHISNCEYWQLDRTNGTSNVNVTLSYKDFAPAVNCSGVTNQADLLVARWNGTQWVSHGNGGTTGTATNGTIVTSAAVTAFSPFTLATNNSATNPLPVELISFNAEPKANKVILNWTSATEINNDYFELEKSSDGINFQAFAKVKGAGFNNQILNYSYTDTKPFIGTSYYRLKQVDFDGTFTYSENIAVNFSKDLTSNVSFYPNPSSGIINFNVPENENILIELYDLTGKKIYVETINNHSNSINLNNFVNGIYLLSATTSDGNRLLLEKLNLIK